MKFLDRWMGGYTIACRCGWRHCVQKHASQPTRQLTVVCPKCSTRVVARPHRFKGWRGPVVEYIAPPPPPPPAPKRKGKGK